MSDNFKDRLSIFHLVGYLNKQGLWENNHNFKSFYSVFFPKRENYVRVAEGVNLLLIDKKFSELNKEQIKWLEDTCKKKNLKIEEVI